MKPKFQEIPVGTGEEKGWLVYFSDRVVAVLAQSGDAKRAREVRLAGGLIEPFASQWERSWPSLQAASRDFHEVLGLYGKGWTQAEVHAWAQPAM